MTQLWTAGATDRLPEIRQLGYGMFEACPVLQSARMGDLTPTTAAKVCSELEFRFGWASFSNANTAQIIYWPEDNDEKADITSLNGGFLAGEFCSDDGLSFRLRAPEANGLTLWVYGRSLARFLASHPGWTQLPDLQDLIVETQNIQAVRPSHGLVSYDVYWQATRDFGLRPRIALFNGFIMSEGAGK